MNPPLFRWSNFVCRSCWQETQCSPLRTVSLSTRAFVKERNLLSLTSLPFNGKKRSKWLLQCRSQTTASQVALPPPDPTATRSVETQAKTLPEPDLSDPAKALDQLIADSKRIRSSTTVPDNLDVLELLETSRQLAELLIYGEPEWPERSTGEIKATVTSTSSILGLEETARQGAKAPLQMSISFRQKASATVAKNLYNILRDPKIYISLPMLQVYVHIQVLLGKPEYLPEVFHLYAHKPIPHASKSSKSVSSSSSLTTSSQNITYISPFPRNPKNAIPTHLASAALTSAIAVKSLPLALSIIETSVATPSFRLHKILRRASLPFLFLSLTPFCAYTISTYVAHHWQNTYDPTLATWLTGAGIMAYVATTATMGFVALTTSNDQMERVVWRPGTRLRDRWLREEERAAFDRVALAWGFREKWRWGEERGEDWEALKEFCARRDMMLDKTELLEGME
ncbi:hypothetical protein EPUS_05978 [Endocarpon pusillum Z07020]|uniref:Uncharacterized protein n=1 Tax=Endocarpon pusillum (strain Z07020 / HMAS-L-300199) TaxID=1263415 RepID=U1HQ27_ENDPU|nr:uncharacterized protein EPUS_05978 [Endocarpon pusillum Z07020]ERF71149.1 hypothetical protein EPUS_05978 [Endocarpon pusillum Z07020]